MDWKLKFMEIVKEVVATKRDQLVNVVEKVWGREEWIVNNPKYCGKRMILKKGYRCSMHHHKIKDETFYVLSGKVFLETIMDGVETKRILTSGDIVHIRVGENHRFTGLELSEMIEFSTHHMEDDSYRTELSGAVDITQNAY